MYAHAARQAASPPPTAFDLSPTDPNGSPPTTEPSPADSPSPADLALPTDAPPVDPPPAAGEPPAGVDGLPVASDPPVVDSPPTYPPVVADPVPAASEPPLPSEPAVPASTEAAVPDASPNTVDPVIPGSPAIDPGAADAPAVDPPPSEPPVAAEIPPADLEAPVPSDPPGPASIDVPDPEPSPAIGEPALSGQPPAAPVPADTSALPSPGAVASLPARNVASALAPTVVGQPAHVPVVPATAHAVDVPQSASMDRIPPVTELTLPDQLEPMVAGLVAGFAVTNRAPASVAVAIEFGRAGGGWAGAIVFNLWLGRQMRMRRMSQRQLAALSGVDHSTISRLLLHDRRPSLATATKLARALRQVEGETDTADYFERIPEETIFPSRRVEMALRADELLDDEEVLRLMSLYLDARRRRQAAMSSNGRWSNGPPSAVARAGPTRAGPDRRR